MTDAPPATTTRILIVAMPPMLGGIIRELVLDETDIDVVGELADHGDVVPAAVREEADFVIAGPPADRLGAVYRELLAACPATRLLAVKGDGRGGALIQLAPSSTPVGELSPDVLLAVIRGGTRPLSLLHGGLD
jgi:hypothetical protein